MKNYSLGCAFNLNDIVYNFNYSRLKTTCKQCKQAINDNHRDLLVKRVFKECVKIIINDIIDNNITFHLPVQGAIKCDIHMRRYQDKIFKDLRRGGKWKGVDIFKSMFSGYEICMFLYGKRTPRIKSIYLNKELREKITENTNNGFQYGDSNKDKYLKDYYQQIYEIFPTILKSDINRILNFCWKSLYLHNSYGGDVLVSDNTFWCYFGNLKKKSLSHFYYYIRKLTVKLRVLYKRKKIEWDGYYYFALSDSQYQRYLDQKNKTGRPKRRFKFGSVYAYQILDECKINEHYKRYIFKVPFITYIKQKIFLRDFESDKAQLILTRDSLKFKDILIHDNEYEFL